MVLNSTPPRDPPVIQTNPAPATVEGAPVKAGMLSTEFWGKLVIQVVVLLNSWFGIAIDMDMDTSITIVAGLEALYIVIRGLVKASSYKTVTVIEKESA